MWKSYTAQKSGLRLQLANNSVSEGIHALYERFSTSRIKVVETCTQLIKELRMYQTNDKNEIIKVNDDLIDALRYANIDVHKATTKLIADEESRRTPTMKEMTFNLYE